MTTQPTPISDTVTLDRKTVDPIENATINGVLCDTTTAEIVFGRPGGCGNPWTRFDEMLYRSPDGWFFIVRPFDPDEAKEWMGREDKALVEQYFPKRSR